MRAELGMSGRNVVRQSLSVTTTATPAARAWTALSRTAGHVSHNWEWHEIPFGISWRHRRKYATHMPRNCIKQFPRHPGPGGKVPDPDDGPTVLRMMLGTQLRSLRESRHISAHDAAKAIRASASKISRIELGRSAIREIDVLDLLTFYGVGPEEREQFLALAEQANRPGWWHRFTDIMPDWFKAYIGMEEAAKSIRVYDPLFVPGLLQTPQYAAAVLALGDIPVSEAERHVILRKERQRRFTDGQLKLWAIVDESALRRPVGSLEILRDQLRYLVSLSSR